MFIEAVFLLNHHIVGGLLRLEECSVCVYNSHNSLFYLPAALKPYLVVFSDISFSSYCFFLRFSPLISASLTIPGAVF